MKHKLLIVLLFLCGIAKAQEGIYVPETPTVYGEKQNRIKPVIVQHLPEKTSKLTNTTDTSAQIFYYKPDSSIWAYSRARGFWKIGEGGGGSSDPVIIDVQGPVLVAITETLLGTRQEALDSLSRLALSVTGTGATYDNETGVFTFTGTNPTASNGVAMVDGDIQLGNPLTKDDTIPTSGHTLLFTGTSTSGHPLVNILDSGSNIGLNVEGSIFPIHGKTADGTGVWGEATGTGSGIFGTSNSGYGLNGTSVSGAGVRAYSTGANGAGRFELQRTSTNTVEPVLQIRRTTTGSPLDGIGQSIDYYGQRLFGPPTIANQTVSRWTDITNVTSQFDITGMNNVNPEVFARFQPASTVIVGDGADTLATLRDLRAGGGGGSGGGSANTIYTTDDYIHGGDRKIYTDSNKISIVNNAVDWFQIDPAGGNAFIASYAPTDGSYSYLSGSTHDGDAAINIGTNYADGTKAATIDAAANSTNATFLYSADTHTFVGNIINNADSSTAPAFNVVTIDENNILKRAALPATGLTADNFVYDETPSGAVNGSNTAYTIANTPIVGKVSLFRNGLLQKPGSGNDYTISGTAITYLTAPETGDVITINYIK